jgi:DNA-3-methyladenine glycosylase II
MLPFDPQQAVDHLTQTDPTLAELIQLVGSFTLQLSEAGFATLVDSILSQQISSKAAASILNRLTEAVEELTPQALLTHTVETLRPLGISRQKAAYLLDLATKVQEGQVNFAQLHQLADEAVIQHLTQVKGIGRWTAEMYLIFALGRPNVFPVQDLGIQQAVQRLYKLTDPPQKAVLKQIAAAWDPYCTVASWYLWRSLDLEWA